MRLGSDVDLVAVVSEPQTHPDLGATVRDEMNRRYPDILTTIFVVDGTRLHSVRSLFGRDFWTGSRRPIIEGSPLLPFAAPPVGHREYVEVIVHQLTSILLLPRAGAAPATAAGHRAGLGFLQSKLALEALRALVEPGTADPVCFADLLDDELGARACQVVGRPTVERLVRYRELSLDLTGVDVDRLVIGAIQELLGTVASADPGRATLAVLAANIAASNDEFLILFQSAVLLLFALRTGPADQRIEAAAHLLAAVGALPDDDLRDGRAGKRAITTRSAADLAADALADGLVTEALRAIRLDYYHHLGPHNFGIRPRPGYERAAIGPLAEQHRRWNG
jgi:hypothetical protein